MPDAFWHGLFACLHDLLVVVCPMIAFGVYCWCRRVK